MLDCIFEQKTFEPLWPLFITTFLFSFVQLTLLPGNDDKCFPLLHCANFHLLSLSLSLFFCCNAWTPTKKPYGHKNMRNHERHSVTCYLNVAEILFEFPFWKCSFLFPLRLPPTLQLSPAIRENCVDRPSANRGNQKQDSLSTIFTFVLGLWNG